MNQLSQLAVQYHSTLESWATLRAVPRSRLAALGLTGLIFGSNFLRLVLGIPDRHGLIDYFLMIQMLISETLLLGLVMAVRRARDQAVCQRVSAVIGGSKFDSLAAAKTALLSHLFHQPASSFLRLAEDARKCLELHRAPGRGLGLRQDDLFNFFYHPEARPRITALLLATGTGISALALFSPEIREEGLALLYEIRANWLSLWLTGVTVLAGAAFMGGVLHRIAWWAGEHFARFFSDSDDPDPARVRYLQWDLVRHHQFLVAERPAVMPRSANWTDQPGAAPVSRTVVADPHCHSPSQTLALSCNGPSPASLMPG